MEIIIKSVQSAYGVHLCIDYITFVGIELLNLSAYVPSNNLVTGTYMYISPYMVPYLHLIMYPVNYWIPHIFHPPLVIITSAWAHITYI